MNPVERLTTNLLNHHYVSRDIKLEFNSSPFNYLTIENLFNQDIYSSLCNKFPDIIGRMNGQRHGAVGVGKKVYNAIIASVNPEEGVGYDFFATKLWKDSLSNFFDIELNQHLSYSAHYHEGSVENPSNSGWVHLDLNICSAKDDSSKEVKTINDCIYNDDTNSLQPNTRKVLRSIAVLYYLNNPENINEEDGGGTGLYSNYNLDSRLRQVLPKNNSAFIFEISPLSYHAFIGAKYNRSAMVHWFHSSPSYIVKRNFNLFKERFHNNNGEIFERWKKEDLWTLDKDPDYNKYFDKPYSDIFL
jgi:hypothetical protein